MTFNSIQYALFLPVVVALHWLLPRRARLPLIVISSYVFYGTWDHRFLTLLAISTLSDYWIALALGRNTDERRRRMLLITSLTINLGILGFFKYSNFFIESAASLLSDVGLEANVAVLRVVLPVGISFYTFQTLSYTFDVYRRRIEPCRNLVTFAAFVAYFPGLVAGPIERARRLLPRLVADRQPPNAEQIRSALGLIVLGLFKKVVLADQMAPIVERTFSSPHGSSGFAILVAVVAFSIQLYGDFSGYSAIARGSSRLLSIELMVNFEQPYLSRNITEFWRRWHISLSTWLRDYLYVPLGGNRGSRFNTYRNLMITMTLGGLWHGAGSTFLIWGAIHGIFLCAHRAFGGTVDADERLRIADVSRVVVTFGLTCFGWLFFRATSYDEAIAMAGGLLTWRGSAALTAESIQVALWLVLMFGIDLAQRAPAYDRKRIWMSRPVLSGSLAGAALTLILLYSGSASVPFIYFQF